MKKALLAFLLSVSLSFSQSWDFATSDNPAYSDVGTPASISPGDYSLGWWGDSLAQTATLGFWDLGISGVIETSVSAGTQITVTTVEWYDGGIYAGFATLEIPGFLEVITDIQLLESSPGFPGAWYLRQSTFSGAYASSNLIVTGQPGGTLINSLEIVSTGSAPVSITQSTKNNKKSNPHKK